MEFKEIKNLNKIKMWNAERWAVIIFPLLFIIFYGCAETSSNNNEIKSSDTLNLDAKKDSLNCQFLWDGDCSYQLCETKGWIAYSDSTPIGDSRRLVIYYPESTINHIESIGIYSNVILKKLYKDTTINGFLKGEKERALKNGEKVTEGESIKTEGHKMAVIKNYFIEKAGEYFSIAYIEEPKYIIMVTYSCKNLNDYNTHYNSFREIVRSYKYLGFKVINE